MKKNKYFSGPNRLETDRCENRMVNDLLNNLDWKLMGNVRLISVFTVTRAIVMNFSPRVTLFRLLKFRFKILTVSIVALQYTGSPKIMIRIFVSFLFYY